MIPRPADKTERQSKGASHLFFLLSVVTHMVLFAGLRLAHRQPPPPAATVVEVEYFEPTVLDSDSSALPRPPSTENKNDHIVEQKNQLNDEVDPNTKFLSAFNQKVVKQTRAERSGKFTNTAKGGQPDEGQADGDKESEENVAEKPAPRKRGELPDLKDLTPKYSLNPGPKAPSADENGDPSQTDDYIKDVNKGMQTLLSTREFVYYSYYARIKDAIRQHWEPDVREKVKIIYRKGRHIASTRDRITQVLVTLNSDGDLIQVDILNESGVEQLDDAAVDAFRSAAPFPNPPKGMVEPDGTIKIRWDFVLEV